jgi:hypothetical protein
MLDKVRTGGRGTLWDRSVLVLAFLPICCSALKEEPNVPPTGLDAGSIAPDARGEVGERLDLGDGASNGLFTPKVEWGKHRPELVETAQVIPGPGLPDAAVAQESNNNLDVIRHSDGRLYLAWRTGPDHFASAQTRLHVVSKEEGQDWRFEATFARETDLREPRWLSLGDELFLYLAELGSDSAGFVPKGMLYSRRDAQGKWGELTSFYREGFIPWRAKIERGTAYLVAYEGGENIYRFNGLPLSIELLTTTDGVTFEPAGSDSPVVLTGGGSETDFVLTDDGDLLAVVRNEAGDETGWGSKICRASRGNISAWTCVHDPKKYDSPAMFWYDGEAYLVARRNVTPDGRYDLGHRDERAGVQSVRYQLDYINHRKRCALWRYVQDEDRIAFMMDLPSRGDTCFPAVVPHTSVGDFAIYNYSSPIDGEDFVWRDGQRNPTFIYRYIVRFVER